MKKISPRALSRGAMIAALYFIISIAFLPLSFGAVQVRIAEALALLPVVSPIGIWGVTLGCALTNAYGTTMGSNILGAADVFFGTAATLIAAILSYLLRNYRWKGLPVLAAIPPVLINAFVVGGELTFAETGGFPLPLFWMNAVSVGLGQFVSCMVIGLVLVSAIERRGFEL